MRGDAESRSSAIEAHLPLVHSLAKRYAGRGEPLDDLVQVGTIGLIKAVDRFDPARGRSLSALARPLIESEIRHHLRDRSSVMRVPRTDQELAARLGAAETELTMREGRTPTTAEVAAGAGVDEARAARSARTAPPVQLEDRDAPAPDDSEAVEARLLLARGTEALDDRERRLLHLRYVEDLSQAEIAAQMGLSQAHVSRLLRTALERVRCELDGDPGETVAEPAAKPRSGRLLLRLPQSLHGELAATAEREGVALNTFIAGTLAAAIGWHDPDGDLRPRPRRRSTLLLVNAIVIALAVVTGIALLLVAWLG